MKANHCAPPPTVGFFRKCSAKIDFCSLVCSCKNIMVCKQIIFKLWLPKFSETKMWFLSLALYLCTSLNLGMCTCMPGQKWWKTWKSSKSTFFIWLRLGSCRKNEEKQLFLAIGSDFQTLVDTQKLVTPGKFYVFDCFSTWASHEHEAKWLF